MIQKLTVFALLLTLCTMAPMVPLKADPNAGTGNLTTQVQQSVTLATGAIGSFVGTLKITSFAVQNGNLVAIGTLSGNLLDAAGNILQTLTNVPITTLVTSTHGTCQILTLVLGPLHLSVLGLNIDLNQVVLNITAVPGAGNLLGNLLCAVAHLLDSNGTLADLASLLNQIIGALHV